MREALPRFQLLDARTDGLDPASLRRLTRATTADTNTMHHSRSYRYPYALVAWHNAPVGIDIERIDHHGSWFADLICTPAEKHALAATDDPDLYLTSLWCAKEALTKALGHPIDYDPKLIESPLLWPNDRNGPWQAHQLAAPHGHVAWLCWQPSTQ